MKVERIFIRKRGYKDRKREVRKRNGGKHSHKIINVYIQNS